MLIIQQLIMILKIFKTSLSRVPYNSLIRTSTYLMSNDDDNKKGFGNFKRRNTPKDKKQEQTAKAPEREPEKKVQTQKEKPKEQKAEGFSNFKRRSSPNQPKPQQKVADLGKNTFQQTKPQSQQKNNFSAQQNIKRPFQAQNESKPEQKNNQSTGFSKFQRRHNVKPQANKIQKQKTQKPSEPKPEIKKDQKTQSQRPTINFDSSFKNFNRKNAKPVRPSIKNQPKQEANKNFVFEQKKDNQQKPKQKIENVNELKGFQKFANRSNRKPKQNNEQNKQEQRVQSESHAMKKEPAAQPAPKQPQKTIQQLEKQQAQLDLKIKQQFFKKKLLLYKNMKAQQQQKPKYRQIVQQTRKKVAQNIYRVTGIDIYANPDPPNWVKNNPILIRLYLQWRLILMAFIAYLIYTNYEPNIQNVSSEQFVHFIETGQSSHVNFEQTSHDTETQIGKKTRTYAFIYLKNGQVYKTVSNNEFQSLIKNKVNIYNSINTGVNVTEPPIVVTNGKRQMSNTLGNLRFVMSMAMLYLFFSSLFGGGRAPGGRVGSKNAKLFQQSKSKRFQQKVNVKFDDVVGMQKSKEEIVEFIDFLSSPEKYHKLGAKIPRGALLTGPPGTGKTMIAKACAGESNVPFFTISGSQFIEMYVGVGAQRVRDLFAQARKAAPSIIFIDEIDAVGKKRSAGFGGGNDERDNTLNQLLVQMDGFESNSNVIVFAATNQKDVLDPALTRPGRFDRLIQVDLPDIEGRKQIFMVHLKPIVIDSESTIEVYARRMATLTPGFSGADIKNLCNQAAIMAARNGNKFVTIRDFQLATERVIAGVEKKSHLITEQTRKVVAYHQCGHGVVSWFLQGANPLLKLTIIPRSKGSLGFAQYLPHETQISNKKQLQDQICVILAGRVTEQVFFGKISTGAYDDLQKAYNIAKMIVTQYGMNQKLGWLTYEQSQYAKYYSRHTQQLIDSQITKIIKECTDRSRNIINQKKQLIDKLAHKLLEVQTIDLTKISEILGERPFKPNKQYEEYLQERRKMIEEGKEKDGGSEGGDGQGGKKEESVLLGKKADYLV